MVAFAGTDVQERLGIEDSSELLYQDLLAVGERKNVPSLVRAVWQLMECYKEDVRLVLAGGRGWLFVESGENLLTLPIEVPAEGKAFEIAIDPPR